MKQQRGGCLLDIVQLVFFVLVIAFLVTHWSAIWHWVTTVQW